MTTTSAPTSPVTPTGPGASAGSPQSPPAPTLRRWRSAELFGRAQEIEIEHGPAVYRLRMTSLGKLILTK